MRRRTRTSKFGHCLSTCCSFCHRWGKKAVDGALAKQTLQVRISNDTDVPLMFTRRFFTRRGCGAATFSELAPGDFGSILFELHGGHGGVIEFLLGAERLLLGVSCPTIGGFSFSLHFLEKGARDLGEFYRQLPAGFLGEGDSRIIVSGSCSAARICDTVSASPAVANVLLARTCELPAHVDGFDSSLHALCQMEDLTTPLQLDLVKWCEMHKPSLSGSLLFLSEFRAVERALASVSSTMQARALDILISTFVTSGALGSAVVPSLARETWWRLRSEVGVVDDSVLTYKAYEKFPDIETYVEASLSLLGAVVLQCASVIKTELFLSRHFENWRSSIASNDSEAKPVLGECSPQPEALTVNETIIVSHLSSRDLKDTATWQSAVLNFTGKDKYEFGDITKTIFSNLVHPSVGNKASGRSAMSDDTIMALIQHCIHTSAEVALRRQEALRALVKVQSSEKPRAALKRYIASLPVPVSRRTFVIPKGGGLPDVRFDALSPEIFAGLDESTTAEQILQSLGKGAGNYKMMATNSKSGEFFFFSHDRRYLIKSVSQDEGVLLHRMLPKYSKHISDNPESLIVRYAGLFILYFPDRTSMYFTVMKSIFDPDFGIDSHYDLKGSTHKRRKRQGESTGKDEDWILDKRAIVLSSALRQKLLDAHHRDAHFLARFHVMDYSLLVGIHHYNNKPSQNAGGKVPLGGILSKDGCDVYFAGIIDFLIAYGFKKQVENLMNEAMGIGDSASCVDPHTYATRQAIFLRMRVFVKAKSLCQRLAEFLGFGSCCPFE